MAELVQLVVAEDRRLDLDLPARLGCRLQQVELAADALAHRHDDLFADAIDRRVCHLREELLEVVVEQLRPVREHGQGGVIPHRPDRLVRGLGHRGEQDAQVLVRVAERLLPLQDGLVVRLVRRGHHGQRLQRDGVLFQPLAVGLLAGDLLLQLVVLDDSLFLQVKQEHLSGLQSALADDLIGRNVEDADLGRHDDQAVLGDVVARRSQAIAVEDRADLHAVGEGDGRGAVPRLHEAAVVLVERLLLGAHQRVAGPWLGDHHHDRVRQRPARQHEQLQRVVEHRRVAAGRVDHGQDFLQVVAEQLVLEETLPGVHPVDVAAERVDLAIVADVAVRVRPRPVGERVRAEARMHHRQGGGHRRVVQVREVQRQLPGGEHPLVHERPVRQARHIEDTALHEVGAANRLLDPFANDVQLALEGVVVAQAVVAADEHLADGRLGVLGGFAERGMIRRHVAPAEQRLPFLADDLVEHALDDPPLVRVGGQEHAADAVAPGRGERDVEAVALLLEEGVWHLEENARAVAGVLLATARAAVLQVEQNLDGLLDQVVRFAVLEVGDEADAAGVVLVVGVVQPLLGGVSVRSHVNPPSWTGRENEARAACRFARWRLLPGFAAVRRTAGPWR